MRNIYIIVALLCCLAAPAFAEETSSATTTRVHETEKANIVLQEDLARTEITLNKTRSDLKATKDDLKATRDDLNATKDELLKTKTMLDEEATARKAVEARLAEEISARKALMEALTLLKNQLATEIADRAAALKAAGSANATDNAALSVKIDALTKALADQAAKDAKAMEAIRLALQKEHADRLAAEDDAAKARTKLAKDGKSTRTIMTVLGVVIGGLAIAK